VVIGKALFIIPVHDEKAGKNEDRSQEDDDEKFITDKV
jgi:hypothetical protein